MHPTTIMDACSQCKREGVFAALIGDISSDKFDVAHWPMQSPIDLVWEKQWQ